MIVTQLESTARALVSSGRGILAADESHPTLGKRFSSLAKGDAGRIAAGQSAFHHRARLNGLARSGRYAPEMEQIVG